MNESQLLLIQFSHSRMFKMHYKCAVIYVYSLLSLVPSKSVIVEPHYVVGMFTLLSSILSYVYFQFVIKSQFCIKKNGKTYL